MDTRERNTIFCIVAVMLSVFCFQNALGYQINLNKQLNLISLPEQPANTAIDQVTSSIAGKFNSIWAYVGGSWKLYNPGDPNFSDLLTMEAGRGYWIDMEESGALLGTGTAAPSSIPLSAGWNLVGYNCGSLEISNALASIAGKYESVWAFKDGVWKFYDPANPNFSDLTTIEPGFGYWINAKQSTTWTCSTERQSITTSANSLASALSAKNVDAAASLFTPEVHETYRADIAAHPDAFAALATPLSQGQITAIPEESIGLINRRPTAEMSIVIDGITFHAVLEKVNGVWLFKKL